MSLAQGVCPKNHLHSSGLWPHAQVTQTREAELRHRCFWDILHTVTKGETMDGLSDCCWSAVLNKGSCWPADAASSFNGNIPRKSCFLGTQASQDSPVTNAWSTYSLDPDLISTPSHHIHTKIQIWELEVWRCYICFFAIGFLLTSVICLKCCCFLLYFCLLLKVLFFLWKRRRMVLYFGS